MFNKVIRLIKAFWQWLLNDDSDIDDKHVW